MVENTVEREKKIDRLKAIKQEIEKLSAEKDRLESEIINGCEQELANTQYKTLTYTTDSGSSATVTLAESLKLIYPTLLKSIFGKAYSDMVKEETKYTLSAPAKRLLTNICTGKYIRQTLSEAINQLPVDNGIRKKLEKKLKGANFDTDKKNLINIGGLNADDASEYAYLLNESATWQQFETLLRLNEIESDDKIEEVITRIKTSMIVDETPKVSIA